MNPNISFLNLFKAVKQRYKVHSKPSTWGVSLIFFFFFWTITHTERRKVWTFALSPPIWITMLYIIAQILMYILGDFARLAPAPDWKGFISWNILTSVSLVVQQVPLNWFGWLNIFTLFLFFSPRLTLPWKSLVSNHS